MKLEINDIPVAFTLLTRLPISVDHARAGERGAMAAWAYPLVGVAIGLIAGSLGWGLLKIGVSHELVAVFVIAMQVLITGALHEDGLADMADGMGGYTVERRLEIMKDSHIGAFGAIALILAILARHSGISSQSGADLPLTLAALGAGSRALMVATMGILPNARAKGMSASAGAPPKSAILIALAIGLASSWVAFGWFGSIVFAVMAVAAVAIAILSTKMFGGQTGDVLGATQQSTEITGFACLL